VFVYETLLLIIFLSLNDFNLFYFINKTTKQNKTKQNKTKQNKTKQNKTKQNKTNNNIKMYIWYIFYI
jgi:hypothetical protein